MTLLGASVYAGFFALSALWLAATDPDEARSPGEANGQDLLADSSS